MVSFASSRCPQCGDEISGETMEGLCAGCLLERALGDQTSWREGGEKGRPAEEEAATPTQIDGYQLHECLGRGGMGVVFRAKCVGDDEVVALKTLAAGPLASPQEVKRFRLEAEAVARLGHPHIVPVYMVGEEGGRHYFVMKLAEGGSVVDLVEQRAKEGHPVEPEEGALLVSKVAQAVHFAHQRGLLHRDIKPANILLDEKGEPMVADFGLAKQIHGSTQLTLAGAALGTPSFMAPEQTGGTGDEVTTAADVYGLGALLYFVLTGAPPLSAATPLELLRRIGTEQPLPPRRLGVEVDRDLELICLKCLEKEPERRYASARALADDLESWRKGLPIVARPATVRERLRAWRRRRPVAAVSVLITGLGLLLLGGVLLGANFLLQAERNTALAHEENARGFAEDAAQQATEARASRDRMRQSLYVADLVLASRALEEGNLGLARASLRRQMPTPGERDLRGFEWFAYHQMSQGDEWKVLEGHEGAVTAVAYHPSGKVIASAGRDGTVKFWSANGESMEATLPRKNAPARAAELILFPPLIAQSPDLRAYLTSGKGSFDEIRMRARPSSLGEFRALAWSHDGKVLVSGSQGSFVRLWSWPELRLKAVLPVLNVRQLAFTPDDRKLVIASEPYGDNANEIRIYELESLKRLRTIANTRPTFAMDKEGKRLVVATGLSRIEVQDLESGRVEKTWESSQVVYRLSLAPGGRRLAVVENGGRTLSVRDIVKKRVLKKVHLPEARLTQIQFGKGGDTLIATSDDHTVRLFESASLRELQRWQGHEDEVRALALSPSGKMMVTGANDHRTHLWAMELREGVLGGLDQVRPLILSGEGGEARAVTVHSSGLAEHAIPGRPLVFLSKDGRYASINKTASGKPGLYHGELQTMEDTLVAELDLGKKWRCVGAHAGTKRVVVGDQRGGFRFFKLDDGQLMGSLQDSERMLPGSFSFSPDGSRFACLAWPRKITVWDCESGERLARWEGATGTVHTIAFSPDGKVLLSGGDDTRIRAWDAATGTPIATMRGHKGSIRALVWSPDGRTIVSSSGDLSIRLWQVESWRELGVLHRGLFAKNLRFLERNHLLVIGQNDSVHLLPNPR